MEDEKKLVVIVDDNLATLQSGKNVLSSHYRVATAPSGTKLFEILETNIPVIILLDIEIPDSNGYEIIKNLKNRPDTKEIPVIFLTGKTDPDDELMGLSLGAVDYITKPFQPSLLLKRVEMHELFEAQKKKLENQSAELLYYSQNMEKLVWEETQNVLDMRDALLKTMAEMVERRDYVTGSHIERTHRGVKILIDEIVRSGLYPEEMKNLDLKLLLQSCRLHDIGKISIADNILKKPGKLTDEEFEEIKKHTVYGVQIIEKCEAMTKKNEFLSYAKIFAASHHEKWDGSGYPHGLKGEAIPLLGRVMAIADVYDALTTQRPYKDAFPHEKAVQIITECSGTQFDPSLVKVFLQTADKFKAQDSL